MEDCLRPRHDSFRSKSLTRAKIEASVPQSRHLTLKVNSHLSKVSIFISARILKAFESIHKAIRIRTTSKQFARTELHLPASLDALQDLCDNPI